MAEVGIAAIVVGAILLALGLSPGLLPALIERFQGLRDHFFPLPGRIHKFQTDYSVSSDIWLIVSGGVMMILGLFVLLS
jgi:uncharacterized membrane protein HdeD (DUF308 family)